MVRYKLIARRPGRPRAVVQAALFVFSLALATLCGVDAQARTLVVETLDEPLNLSGSWSFAAGDDPAWSDPAYDDSNWDEMLVPGGWGQQGYPDHSGLAWYRLELDLSQALRDGREDLQLGLQLGEVTSSYELYAGGKRIGGVGGLPPSPRMEYDRHQIYRLPMALVDGNDRVVLAMRVWRSPITRSHEGGPRRGPFFIGRMEHLSVSALLQQIPHLVLIAIFVAVGLYHLRLYVGHRGLIEHFWFGCFVLNVAAYCLLRTQWKYALSDDFILLKNLEYVAIYALPVIGIQFVAKLFSRPIARWLRAYQLSFVAMAALAGLTPDLRFNISTLWLGQLWVLPVIVLAGIVGFQEFRRGHPQAKLLPSACFLAACLFDLAVDQDWLSGPRMVPIAMTVMIFSMAASLANRLIQTRLELEDLTGSLEARVTEQTAQLREHTEQLEEQNGELEEAHSRLRKASLTDPLTGLSNRRFVSEYLDHDVARVLRGYAQAAYDSTSPERNDLVFMMLDLDHFKAVNDHYGHDAGDRVLAQTAKILRGICRDSDFVVRWGGEEFLVISRYVDRSGAPILAERIRAEIDQHSFDVGDGRVVSQTCSIGFSSFPFIEAHPTAYGWNEMLVVADRMLYLAKENGRDRWAGVTKAFGEPDEDLPQRISQDFSGCVSRGEIECQISRLLDELESVDPEKDEE